VNQRWHRCFSLLFTPGFQAVAAYRLDRCMYLMFGKGWQVARVVLSPLSFLIKPWLASCEIHYGTDIGPGLHILHPSLGVVVTDKAVIGSYFTITGGNCIGTKGAKLKKGDIQIGDYVILGANAVVLGPIRIGDRAVVSACSLAMRDIGPGEIVGGVPAKPLMRRPVG